MLSDKEIGRKTQKQHYDNLDSRHISFSLSQESGIKVDSELLASVEYTEFIAGSVNINDGDKSRNANISEGRGNAKRCKTEEVQSHFSIQEVYGSRRHKVFEMKEVHLPQNYFTIPEKYELTYNNTAMSKEESNSYGYQFRALLKQMKEGVKFYGPEIEGEGMSEEELQEQLSLMSFIYNGGNYHILSKIYDISQLEDIVMISKATREYAVVKLEEKGCNHIVLLEIVASGLGKKIKIVDSLESNSKFVSQVEQIANKLQQLNLVSNVEIVYQGNNQGECAAQTLIEILNGVCPIQEEELVEKLLYAIEVVQQSSAVSDVGYFESAIANITMLVQTTGNITAAISSLDEIAEMVTRANYNMLPEITILEELEPSHTMISDMAVPKVWQREKEERFQEDKKKLFEAVKKNDVIVVHEVFNQHDQFYHEELMNVRNGDRGIVLDNLIDIAERNDNSDVLDALHHYASNSRPTHYPILELSVMTSPEISAINLGIGFNSIFAVHSLL